MLWEKKMTINYSLNSNIPVIDETDVLVVGGGPGGFSAAVMAARQGAKTMLVERNNAPGGMAYLGEVSPFMSNHINNVTLDAPLYVDWNFEMWKLLGLPEEEFSRDVVQNTPLSKEISMLAAENLLKKAVKSDGLFFTLLINNYILFFYVYPIIPMIVSYVILGTFWKVCCMSTRSVNMCPSLPNVPIFTTGTLISIIFSTS